MPKCKQNYRDMEKYQNYSRRMKRAYYGKTTNAQNSHQPWTVREIEIVMAHEMPDMEISKLIGRSVKAIQSARNKYKKEEYGNNHHQDR